MLVTTLLGHVLDGEIRSIVADCNDGGIKDRNPTAEVVFELCFRRVILDQGKTHHFIIYIQHYKDFMLSVVDGVMHDVEFYCNVGMGRGGIASFCVQGSDAFFMHNVHRETSSKMRLFRACGSLRHGTFDGRGLPWKTRSDVLNILEIWVRRSG